MSRVVVKSYKTKLNTSLKQFEELKQLAGAYRFVYNFCMDALEYNCFHVATPLTPVKYLTFDELRTMFFAEKSRYPFLKKVEQGIIESAIYNAQKTYETTYVSRVVPHMTKKQDLKFKTKTRIKIFDKAIKLPKCSELKLYEENYLPKNAQTIKDTTFTFNGKNWFISFKAEINVSENKEIKRNMEEILDINFKEDGTLVVNGKEYANIIKTAKYQKEFAYLKKLLQKYRRQCAENTFYSKNCFRKVLRTSRNMLKTKAQIRVSMYRLNNMKLDYFRKVSHKLAIAKSGSAQLPSNNIIRKYSNNFLSRAHREASTAQFFDILRRTLKHSGITILRRDSWGVRPELQGVSVCGEGTSTSRSETALLRSRY